LRYLLSPELFGLSPFELLPAESPLLLLEELPELFSVLLEVAEAPASALPPLSLPDDAVSELPSDLAEDDEAEAEPLRA
jgi:hypothetical protein